MNGTPLPKFSDDDVVDFCVAEAVGELGAAERARQNEKQKADAEKKEWKSKAGKELPG